MILEGSCHCKSVSFTVESQTPYPYMRCYCSICRKTAGGGGYAINIMALAKTLSVSGRKHIKIYHAILGKSKQNKPEVSSGQRHFCKQCGSCLWIFDPQWLKWIYPFASAIDTSLPKPKERQHIMLDYAANWCRIPKGKNDFHFTEYPEESIEHWHKERNLFIEKIKRK